MNVMKRFLLFVLISLAAISSYSGEEKKQKTLLIFSAKWCQYCQVAKKDINNNPQLSEIVKEYEIIELDATKDKDIMVGHEVKSLPTFIVFQDGKETKREVGYRGLKELIKFLK